MSYVVIMFFANTIILLGTVYQCVIISYCIQCIEVPETHGSPNIRQKEWYKNNECKQFDNR